MKPEIQSSCSGQFPCFPRLPWSTIFLPMPDFDEATLRKAATWQDFKEAQGLLNAGAVQESEKTSDGWRGTVRIGKRIFRTTVTARTPTWLDAKCPCSANQREGSFCPHAIATGLHLINPPETKIPESPRRPAKNPIPALAWKIQFQGPWQKTIAKGQASIALTSGEHPPTPADEKLTIWLLANKAASSASIQLVLTHSNLSGFLAAIEDHPAIISADSSLTVDSGAQLHLTDCSVENDTILLSPGDQNLVSFGDSHWLISSDSLSRITPQPPDSETIRILGKLVSNEAVHLPLKSFVSSLSSLQSVLDFTSSQWFESLQFIPEPPLIRLVLNGSTREIHGILEVSYTTTDLPKLDGNIISTTDPAAEKRATAILKSLVPEAATSDRFTIANDDSIRQLLTTTLKKFPSAWQIELSPTLRELSTSYVFIRPEIRILNSNNGLIEFDLSYRSNTGEIISPAEIRRLLRSSSSIDRSKITLSDDIENLIDPIFQDLDLEQANDRFIAKGASASIIEEIRKKISNSLSDSRLVSYSESIGNVALPQISATLRPYQILGFQWLNDRLKRYYGALLADDMGLGKTIQTIAYIEHLFTTLESSQPVLIVVTTSLLGNWLAEIARFTPHRHVVTLHGASRDKLREKITPETIVLTTYATLARDLAWHLRQEYSLAVIDEASLIRNPDTDHSKAVAKLNAARRLALTGTPVENSARDLWSIFRFIQPSWLGTRKDFNDRYEQPLKSPDKAGRTSELLRLKTFPFTLRRTKQEVAPELPSKIAINEICELSKDQLATYRELQKEGLSKIAEIRDSGQSAAARMQTLTLLLRLRQTCCDLALLGSEKLSALPIPRRSGKLERLLEITTQSIASGSKLLIFSQFQKQLVGIEAALETLEIPSLRLDGQTRNRQALVDRFQSADGPPVFLISLKAGGYGLNLTAADVVVHFDPWWNPAAEAQATDRAHRIGQTKPVTVFRLLTRGTVEEKVIELQSSKKALADSLDESATPINAPAWSAAELEKLLR